MEKQSVLQILICICSLSYPVCEVHVPYYTVHCSVSGPYCIFPPYLMNGMILGKKLWNIYFLNRIVKHTQDHNSQKSTQWELSYTMQRDRRA